MVGQTIIQPAIETANQPGSLAASQPTKEPASQPASQSASQSVKHAGQQTKKLPEFCPLRVLTKTVFGDERQSFLLYNAEFLAL